MTQFQQELRHRISEAGANLARAREAGDDYLVGVRLGELEGLARLAADHGLPASAAEAWLSEYGLASPAGPQTGPIRVDSVGPVAGR